MESNDNFTQATFRHPFDHSNYYYDVSSDQHLAVDPLVQKHERSIPRHYKKPKKKIQESRASYQYHKWTFIIFVPASLYIYNLLGDVFPGIFAAGAFFVHLMATAGNNKGALSTILLVWLICELLIIYRGTSLIFLASDWWSALSYVPLFVCLNAFSILSAGWICLSFTEFCSKNRAILKVLELLLFTFYPLSACVLITYGIVEKSNAVFGPYIFLCIGFAMFHILLKPTASSYPRKPASAGGKQSGGTGEEKGAGILDETGFIIHPLLLIIIVISYAAFPVGFFAMVNRTSLLAWYFNAWIECAFIGTVSVFFSTFLHLRIFFEYIDVPYRYVLQARWLSAVIASALLSKVMSHSGLSQVWLPYLPVLAGLYFCLSLSSKKPWSYRTLFPLFAASTSIFYIFMLSKLPWHLDFRLSALSVHVWTVLALCTACCFLSLAAVVLSVSRGEHQRQHLGICLLVYTLCQCTAEFILFIARSYSPVTLCITTAVALLVTLRLAVKGKLDSVLADLSASLHCGKLALWLCVPAGTDLAIPAHQMSLLCSYIGVASIAHYLAVVAVIGSDFRDIRDVHEQAASMAFMALFFGPHSTGKILLKWANIRAEVATFVGTSLLLASTVYMRAPADFSAYCNKMAASLSLAGATVLLVQPRISWNPWCTLNWLVCLSVVAVAVVVLGLFEPPRSSVARLGVSCLVGAPLGAWLVIQMTEAHQEMYRWMSLLPGDGSHLGCVAAGGAAVTCLAAAHLHLAGLHATRPKDRTTNQPVYVALIASLAALITCELYTSSFSRTVAIFNCLLFVAGVCAAAAADIRCHWKTKWDSEDAMCRTLMLGNLLALTSYLILLTSSWLFAKNYVLVMLSPLVLVLLNVDKMPWPHVPGQGGGAASRGYAHLHHRSIPHQLFVVVGGICVSLYLVALTHASLFSPKAAGSVTVLSHLVAVAEVFITLTTMPVVCSAVVFLWSRGAARPLPVYLLIVLSPLGSILLLCGNSYYSIVLGLASFAVGLYQMLADIEFA